MEEIADGSEFQAREALEGKAIPPSVGHRTRGCASAPDEAERRRRSADEDVVSFSSQDR